ncbi:MAG: HAMP domain-containing histidine kinase [Bacteroidales bacterium]|nr:HAMP domain-containing histidine kinase [Bacteroidales bacterium]
MKNKGIRLVVLFGAIFIVGIIFFQIFWVTEVYNIKQKQLVESINSALYNVAEKISRYNNTPLQNENPVNQFTKRYYTVNVYSAIDPKVLEHFLQTEFQYRNLEIDYEFAIYDCDLDSMKYSGFYSPSMDTSAMGKAKFTKCDDCVYYFGIHFPKLGTYIVGSMNMWIVFSILLLTATISISVAIFVILKQKRLSEIQKDFINNMTHEFKTPISTISISADVISNPEIITTPARLSNYAAIIKEQNSRLESQVEKVLQFADVDKKELKLNIEEIDIHEIILNVSANFNVNVEKRNGKISFDLNATPGIIKADKFHLINIFYNLLDNAVKYCKETPEINISTRNQKDGLVFAIKDNGIGIKKEHQKKMFDKFYRVPTGNVHNVKGFGIGLNYVKSIVETHGWKIFVESSINSGSEFVIIMKEKKQKKGLFRLFK